MFVHGGSRSCNTVKNCRPHTGEAKEAHVAGLLRAIAGLRSHVNHSTLRPQTGRDPHDEKHTTGGTQTYRMQQEKDSCLNAVLNQTELDWRRGMKCRRKNEAMFELQGEET